jgi:hypothetical protein
LDDVLWRAGQNAGQLQGPGCRCQAVGGPFIGLTGSDIIIKSFKFNNLIAFTAIKFQPILTTNFILSLAQRTLVEGFQFDLAIRDILPTTFSLSRHTDVVYVQFTDNMIKATRYTWCHPQIRPWGQELPPQCLNCGRIRPWSFSRKRSDVLITCANCRHRLNFVQPTEELIWLGGEIFGGRWLVRDLNL